MCSRALSLCTVFQSLRRSHACQVESISVSKSAHTPEHAPVRWPPQLHLLRGHASGRVFLMGVRPHGDSFGGKLNGLQSRAGQQRSHPYGKAVLAASRALAVLRIFFNQHLPLQMVVQGHQQGVPQQRLSTCSRPKVLWALHLWVQQEQQHNQW